MIFDGEINKLDIIGVSFEKVIIKNIKKIPPGVFENKGVKELIIEEGIEEIGEFAFYNNNITKIRFPNSLKIIEGYAFAKNKIIDINLNENISFIDCKAFEKNPVKQVNLPYSINQLGINVFPQNTIIIFNNKQINNNIIEQYEENNFFETYKKIIKIIPDFDINKANIEIISLLAFENITLIKSYWYNKNKFNFLYEKLDQILEKINIKNLFKLCYILGYFSVQKNKQEKLEQFITKLYIENEKTNLEHFIFELPQIKYYPKLAELIIKYHNDENFQSILKEYYMNYHEINKIIKIRKKEKKIKNQLIEETKEITYSDLMEYFNNKFKTKHKSLKTIIPLLSGYITKEQFKKIEYLYENYNKNSVFTFIKEKNDEFEYEWLKPNDIRLFVLGYITNCCFRIGGNGEDILIQNIKNPCIKTMVISYMGKIVGKTTAYYNSNYLLFNNIEISNQFMNNLKITSKEKIKLLKTIILGIKKQVDIMNKKGFKIENIRIGMGHNDLEKELKMFYKIETNNLYQNYEYDGYEPDTTKAQAIIKIRSNYD